MRKSHRTGPGPEKKIEKIRKNLALRITGPAGPGRPGPGIRPRFRNLRMDYRLIDALDGLPLIGGP